MKNLGKVLTSLIILVLSTTASARVVTGKINDLMVWNDGHVLIKIENGPINGCSGQYYYSLGKQGTNPYTDGMLSVALAAYVSGKTVTISSSDAVCVGGEEKVIYIKLHP